MPLDPGLAAALRGIFADDLVTDAATCASYGYDNSRQLATPDAVVFPSDHAQVAALVGACREYGAALTARGRGTNTTGATVPLRAGVVASFERMDRILGIDTGDRMARVEPGVLNADLQRAAAEHGFFWPPDPTSSAYCTVGGNLGCNAGGPRAVKYGTCRENTLGLRAVAGDGSEFRSGTYTTKGATGYDLTRLLIGSEGTLALITEATLKLTPTPTAIRTMRATYASVAAAADAVARIMAQPATPCALEFIDDEALKLARAHAGDDVPEAGAMLMIEVDGDPDTLDVSARAVADAAAGFGLLEMHTAADAAQALALWGARKALSPALRSLSPNKINEDVVVPVSRLPELVATLKELAQRHAIPIVSFGHAGNGNLHVNLLPRDRAEQSRAEACLGALFARVIELDGTLSGEHGIGIAKRPYLAQAIDPDALRLMRGIKRVFDPDGILNPDKLLPDPSSR